MIPEIYTLHLIITLMLMSTVSTSYLNEVLIYNPHHKITALTVTLNKHYGILDPVTQFF
jgi:hypothetical protein